MGAWAEAKTAEGRTYYWNTQTKETSWEKPADFEQSAAPAIPVTPTPASGRAADWSETKAENGRVYYYNKITRETTWEKPAVLLSQPQNDRPDFVAGGRQDFGRSGYDDRVSKREDRGSGLPQKPGFDGPRGGGMPWESRQDAMGGFRGPMPAKTDEPEYGSAEAAEEAFFKLLKRNNITPDTQWQDALRLVIRDREYRAIKDPKARKQAFEKYCREVREQERVKEKERKERLREEFRRMLTTHDEVKHYTRWKTARPLIEREAVFKSVGDEGERRRLFDEYISELKKTYAVEQAELRRSGMKELDSILKALILDPDTRWADAEDMAMNNERFKSDKIFRHLDKIDVFYAFENHTRALESALRDRSNNKQSRYRRPRQARDGFKQLLDEKLREGKIKPGSKWKDLRPLIVNDERYIACLGMPGSEPLDLFWDVVEDEERKLRSKRHHVLDVLDELRYELTLKTPFENFMNTMLQHPKTSYLTEDELKMIFDRLLEKLTRRAEEDKLRSERAKKNIVDNLRIAMKRLEPPVRPEDSYEEVAQRLEGDRDFHDADEEMRKSAFDKHMRRLKERGEIDRDRGHRDRDPSIRNLSRRDDRDRDRDRRRRTRSPEIDPYEADRRKATEARERQFRKASFGLSPPPRDRRDDRYDRDRRLDRHEPMPRIYERERRDRELERERNYISRADPRDRGRALDYGDEDTVGSRPSSTRKRGSDRSMSSKRGTTKRPRRDHPTRSPELEGVLKEEPALQSGSEEGEIEEI